MKQKNIKRFPLTVTEDWLDQIDEVKSVHESKHDFILSAVTEKIKQKREENKK